VEEEMTMIPYEIILETPEAEIYLMTFIDDQELSDVNAKLEAIATLQTMIDVITTPGASNQITVRRGLITPASHHIRKRDLEDFLDSLT
jgi:hypothetical protein